MTDNRMSPDVARLRALLARVIPPLRVEAFNEVFAGRPDFMAMIVRDDEPGCASILAQQLQDQTAEDIVEAINALPALLAALETKRGERGCTCHPDDRPAICQRHYAATKCQTSAEAEEWAAQIVHDAMRWAADTSCTDQHPRWQGGNSFAEDRARDVARAVLALAEPKSDSRPVGEAIVRARKTAADPIACRRDSVGMVDLTAADLRLVLAELDRLAALAQPATSDAGEMRELIEMLSAATNEEGVTVFEHSAEEIGIAVMVCHDEVLAALSHSNRRGEGK